MAHALVELALEAEYAPAAALLVVLAPAAGLRCVDVVAHTALKADARGRTVFALSLARFVLLVPAVTLGLRHGVLGVAWGVCAVRALSALSSVAVAERLLRPGAAGGAQLGRAAGVAVVWSAAFVAGAQPLATLAPPAFLAASVAWAAALWLGLRLALDRRRLGADWRLARGPAREPE